jgi:hypothetical protein
MRPTFPAISREIEFAAREARTISDVLEGPEGPLRELTDVVNQKAAVDSDRLLRNLELAITDSARGIVRVEWANTNRGDYWEPWARVFAPRGPKRRIAYLGLMLGHSKLALRLVGFLWPRWGGLDGRHELVRICRKRFPHVCLPYESSRYPGLGEEYGIVWFDAQLSVKTPLQEIRDALGKQARAFLRTASPVLKDLRR